MKKIIISLLFLLMLSTTTVSIYANNDSASIDVQKIRNDITKECLDDTKDLYRSTLTFFGILVSLVSILLSVAGAFNIIQTNKMRKEINEKKKELENEVVKAKGKYTELENEINELSKIKIELDAEIKEVTEKKIELTKKYADADEFIKATIILHLDNRQKLEEIKNKDLNQSLTHEENRVLNEASDIVSKKERLGQELSADDCFFKGLHLYKANSYNDALNYFIKTIEINPDYDRAFFNQSFIYAIMNNKQDMLNSLKISIEFNIIYKQKAKENPDFQKYWDDPDFQALVKED